MVIQALIKPRAQSSNANETSADQTSGEQALDAGNSSEVFAATFPTRKAADEIAVQTDKNVDGFITANEYEAALKSDKRLVNFTSSTTLGEATAQFTHPRTNPFIMGITKMTTAEYAEFLSMDRVQGFGE